MKRQSRAVKATSKILSWILIALLLAGVLGFVLYFTRGLTRDFSAVYLEIDSSRYLSGDTVQVEPNNETCFQIRSAFGSFGEKVGSEFSVQILPTDDKSKDFEYSVDGKRYAFVSGELDLTSGCDLKQYDNYFTLQLPTMLSDILRTVYAGKSVDCPDTDLRDDIYLRVVVTIGETVLIFPLQVAGRVTGVTLSPGEVIF